MLVKVPGIDLKNSSDALWSLQPSSSSDDKEETIPSKCPSRKICISLWLKRVSPHFFVAARAKPFWWRPNGPASKGEVNWNCAVFDGFEFDLLTYRLLPLLPTSNLGPPSQSAQFCSWLACGTNGKGVLRGHVGHTFQSNRYFAKILSLACSVSSPSRAEELITANPESGSWAVSCSSWIRRWSIAICSFSHEAPKMHQCVLGTNR